MSSVFSFREERELGSGWTQPEKGCGVLVVGLRTVYQDVYLGQLAGEGHVVEMPVKQGFERQGDQDWLKFFACAHLHRTVRRQGLARNGLRGRETFGRWLIPLQRFDMCVARLDAGPPSTR